MEVGEEVSSTSESVTKVSCDNSPSADFPKKVLETPIVKTEDGPNSAEEDNCDKGSKLNGDLNNDGSDTPTHPVCYDDPEVASESITSSGLDNVCPNIVADSSVTSSELGEPKNSKSEEEPQNLAISSPTVSATTAVSPVEAVGNKFEKKDISLELSQLADQPEISKKDVLSLVEKLSMNSSITVSRKEVKPDQKSDSVPEGRVLRLRPTPKTEAPKPSPKSCPKPSDTRKVSTSSNSNSSKHCPNGKPVEKNAKSQKRKFEDSDGESDKPHSFSIQYKGFKTMPSSQEPTKKTTIKMNPFNPAFRRECSNSSSQVCSNFDYSSLQPEYAQYLGLQPLVKFRCSNCGTSSFQTMNALNAHKADCMKTPEGTAKQQIKPMAPTGQIDSTQNEPKSANIKLTRKVFLCSACGTYYELWNLFLHMREAHRRYICLECLGMSSSPEKLSEHLKQKHNIISQTFDDPESFSPAILPQAFYLMCITCDKIYSEEDKFSYHKCPGKKSEAESVSLSVKNPVVSSQTQTTDLPKSSNEQQCTSGAKVTLRRTREATKKLAKLQQIKKEESPKPPSPKEDVEPASEVIESAIGDKSTQNTEVPIPIIEQPSSNAPIEMKVDENESAVPSPHSPPTEVPASELAPITLAPPETETTTLDLNVPLETVPEKEEPMDVACPEEVPLLSNKPSECPDIPNALDGEINENSPAIPTLPLPILFSKKSFKRSSARRKRPLTMKPRSRKRKYIPIPSIQTPGNLLPNPLNNLPYPFPADLPQPEEVNSTSTGLTPENAPIEPVDQPAPQNPVDFKNSNKISLPPNIFKLKMNPDLDSEADSDDSQKLSLVVDESANNSDAENKLVIKKDTPENDGEMMNLSVSDKKDKTSDSEITLAGDDIQPMALALDDKIENVPIQSVLKECVRTSCLSCNYCRHAQKIAVNGKYLALHLLSEHRYMPIKNETPEDVITTLKNSLNVLENMCFNTETYDSTDPSVHVPYDQDTTFDCFQCNFACGTHKDLFAHKRKLHSKPLLLCIMCKTNFFSYSEMLCHLCPGHYKAEIMFHNVHIQYRCCFCRLDTLPSAFRLMVHLRKAHHTCDICLEGCLDQQKLSTHLWKHKVNHLCYRCGISYASKPDITKHLFWKHGHESVLCKKCLQKKWPHVYHFCIPPTSFICEECSASFSKAIALKVHKRLHAQEFPYSCVECDKKFISKKLLVRHEERHRNIEAKKNGAESANTDDDQKDEIINVTDVVDVKEENEGEVKEANDEVKEKSHKKHKKDKKDKVVDLYDLPPLNLSSDSDSSDEEESTKKSEKETDEGDAPQKGELEIKSENIPSPAVPVNDIKLEKSAEVVDEPQKLDTTDGSTIIPESCDSVDPTASLENGATSNPESENVTVKTEDEQSTKSIEPYSQVEGIWENFYKTNPQNHNLPYPLCAMKSEVAYGIIMGDHDYCMQSKEEPVVIKDDVPTSSNLETGFSDDKMEEVNANPERPLDPVTPSDEKKKIKSPKKKIKAPNEEDNSSSSSDSSSDSDSSSCTCGTNCSCSSSSSNSSSSSSSDSDSSGGDDKAKLERRKKRKERKMKQKGDTSQDVVKEEEKPAEVDNTPRIPVDPPIQESELETDESSTDEEFYDKQPGNIANQIIAEKRNQLIMSVAPANNNGTVTKSPQPEIECTPPAEIAPVVPKSKSRDKKRRKTLPKVRSHADKLTHDKSYPSTGFQLTPPPPTLRFPPPYPEISTPKLTLPNYEPPLASQLQTPYQNVPAMTSITPINSASPSQLPENDKSRSSKRRRIPNKFYGYSSGEEEEKPQPKWRKPLDMTPPPPLRIQTPPQPSPTPRIQLTVPKQVIRKPSYHKVQKTPKIIIAPPPPPPQPILHPPPLPLPRDSSETDSDTGLEIQPLPTYVAPLPPLPPPPLSHSMPLPSNEPSTSKPEKDVYCYCRCPYDEVSEMIACDDEACPIEWFHFECVNILVPPRGQWYCPGCRKARGLPT